MKRNILVFPCGSEIGLEIHRSLKYSTHFNIIGGNSIDDHGKFVYQDYIGNIPFIDSDNFLEEIRKIVVNYNIEAIYPATDKVITVLKKNESSIGCKIISSSKDTVDIFLSKSKTYDILKSIIKVPRVYKIEEINSFPIFAKPDIGYGSRGAKLISNSLSLTEYSKNYPGSIYCEYLVGEEYTVDCFTDRNGKLRYIGPRIRNRVMNGISVNTSPINDSSNEFRYVIKKINEKIRFRGAWFAQFKRDENGELTLLEIASRIGGSSSLFRNKGVNFALLSLFDAFEMDVDIIENNYEIVMDRALGNKYKLNIKYNEVYIDFDDCIMLDGQTINTQLLSFIYQCINEKIKTTLITRHNKSIKDTLKKYRIIEAFDEIIHINDDRPKSLFIKNKNSIFIDDSFAERKEVNKVVGIPVFSPDMVESLMN